MDGDSFCEAFNTIHFAFLMVCLGNIVYVYSIAVLAKISSDKCHIKNMTSLDLI